MDWGRVRLGSGIRLGLGIKVKIGDGFMVRVCYNMFGLGVGFRVGARVNICYPSVPTESRRSQDLFLLGSQQYLLLISAL